MSPSILTDSWTFSLFVISGLPSRSHFGYLARINATQDSFLAHLGDQSAQKAPSDVSHAQKAKKTLHNYPKVTKWIPKVIESNQAMNPTNHPIQQKQNRNNHDISVQIDLEISQATYKRQQPLLWRGSAAWAKPLNMKYKFINWWKHYTVCIVPVTFIPDFHHVQRGTKS